MQKATTEEAEYETEPRSFTAWLSPLNVEFIYKRRNKFSLTSFFLGRNSCVFIMQFLDELCM